MVVDFGHTEEIKDLRKQCVPCTAFGFRYCADDDNLVNLNGDKCYRSADDKQEFCKDFNFFSNHLLCDEVEFRDSTACDQFLPDNMEYYKVHKKSITLEPRSSCGFFLYEYTAYLDVTYKYPVTLYHREYKTVKYSDVEFMVTQSDQDGKFPGNNCFSDTCNNYYYVTYGR